MRIIVLGATGMLGHELFKICLQRTVDVHGVVRNKTVLTEKIKQPVEERLHVVDDIRNIDAVEKIVAAIQPDHIINCIGIVKQSALAEDHAVSIAINSLLPHQLEKICERYHCGLLHISTDCVFDGVKGDYKETDLPNARDLYGKSKHLGEVGYGRGITLRTSIIGHEITAHKHGLLEWFLSQTGEVNGFTKAIFSGLTTLELSRVVLDIVIPQNLPEGIYHVASAAISKYDLLKKIADVYGKKNDIIASDQLLIDRSLNGRRFADLTGYQVPSWNELIRDMHADFNESFNK
jgi:dTDP-4-dehydrorhamnose reductase